jgi:hypothetical protein
MGADAMKKAVDPSVPEWIYHIIIGVLFTGLLGVAVYVWNNRETDTDTTLEMIVERATRTNDRQVELDRRLTVLETEFRIHQGTGK